MLKYLCSYMFYNDDYNLQSYDLCRNQLYLCMIIFEKLKIFNYGYKKRVWGKFVLFWKVKYFI